MDEEIKDLLEKNYQLTREVYHQTKYIKKFIVWSQVMGVIKLIIIIIPIVLGIIYLPPLLNNVFKQYQELLGTGGGSNAIKSLPTSLDQFKNLLK